MQEAEKSSQVTSAPTLGHTAKKDAKMHIAQEKRTLVKDAKSMLKAQKAGN
jgi:hypothetical protein